MVIIYDTPRLKLITPHKEYANSILDYHKRNKEFLEIWEPKRPDDFYTLEYQKAWIKAEQKEIIKNSIEEAAILTVIFATLIMLFDNQMLYFFKSVIQLSNLERFEIILLFIPVFLIFSIVYTVLKVLITRKI